MARPALDPLFAPERLLVVTQAGGRADPILECSFPGVETTEIEPTAIHSLGGDVDGTLAVVDVPAASLPGVLDGLAAADVPMVCLRSEVTSGAGRDAIRDAIESGDMQILGPGASVRHGPPAGRNDVADDVENGSSKPAGTAIVADSPAMARSLADRAQAARIDVGPVVGVGDGIDVGGAVVVANLADRGSIDLVVGQLETVTGAFVTEFREVETDTPVAITTRSEPTIGLNDADPIPGEQVGPALLEQAGCCPVASLDRMLDGAPALAGQPPPEPPSVVVVSNAGGPGVMAIDAVGRSSMAVAELADETRDALASVIPEHGSTRNPLDLLADSDIEVFESVLDTVLDDPGVGAAVVISAPSALFSFSDLAEIVAGARRNHEKPLVAALMGGERTHAATRILEKAGIPNYFDPYRAVDTLSLLAAHGSAGDNRRREGEIPASFSSESVRAAIGETGDLAAVESRTLRGTDAGQFLRSIGVESVADERARDDEQARGDERAHSEEQPRGVELRVRARADHTRGRLVAVGVGEFVDAVGDVSVRAVPLSRPDAESMLTSLRAAPLLEGARGTAVVDRSAIITALLGLSTLLEERPVVTDVTIPELVATPDGVRADSVEITTSDP